MTLRDLGLSLARRIPGLDPIARRIYAALPSVLHDNPTSRLRGFFGRTTPVAFIQIGAYDGCAGDPIRPLIVENPHWRGVLVEPQPDAFAALIRNYRAQASRLAFVNAAVAPSPGEKTLYVVPQDEMERLKLPDWLRETASFTSEHVRRHVSDCRIDEITVRTLPFHDLAKLLPNGQVDLVVIDVEGYERDIIEDIDFGRHEIRFLIYEHKHLGESDRRFLSDLLCKHGFRLKAFGRDTVAWRSGQRA